MNLADAMTEARAPRAVPSGWLEGHRIRQARKAGPCEYGITITGDPSSRCRNLINVGDYYVDGELSMETGMFGCQRYCLDHCPEARAAIAKAEGRS